MRYSDLKITEAEFRAKIQARHPHLTEEQLDEILPAIVGTVGRVGAAMGSAAAKGAVKAVGTVANGVAKGVGQVAKTVDNTTKAAGKQLGNKVVQKAANSATQAAQKQLLKRGNKIPAPTQGGGEAEFEIDTVKGQEVTLKNPKPKPGEPQKITYSKQDLDPIIKGLVK